jgi:zinc transport system substrate-binding protein
MKFMRAVLLASASFLAASGPALALDGVIASIKPVHSLVASVMQGVGEPQLIVKGAASPHTYALRPSEAAALEQAKLIFWIGHDMEAFLDKALDSLAGIAGIVELAEAEGVSLLPFREGGAFEAHEDEEDHAAGEDGHEEHAEAGHDEHGEFDMHFWLDPENAKAMVRAIERALVEADPDNAGKYTENAAALQTRLDALAGEIEAEIAPVKGKGFIVFHDAYHYFEKRFGIEAAGSITVSPEVMPGAERISVIKAKVAELGATCVFAEPQFEPKLVNVVIEGTGAKSGVLDPEGGSLTEGPDLYFDLLRNIASSLRSCLAQAS